MQLYNRQGYKCINKHMEIIKNKRNRCLDFES